MENDYDEIYNETATVNDTTYLIQDGELFEDAMVRDVNAVLECEKDGVQKMLEEDMEVDYDEL